MKEVKLLVWNKSKKGSATLYTAEGLPNAVVDRNGFGKASALGYRITYKGERFKTVEAAKVAAQFDYDNLSYTILSSLGEKYEK